ncbi:TPA: hypothetical protein QDB44_001831 [Burkholderia vietnamiensis]|nr:hypothetical protein [Burkholderia vietnamiensis]
MKLNRYLLAATIFLTYFSLAAYAQEAPPKVVRIYKSDKTGKTPSRQIFAGLVNMGQIYDEPGSNCEQFLGLVKVEGIQFSSSGGTLESFRFSDNKGAVWSVPTNIGALSNVDRQEANSFIKVGKTYYAHIQACGSGGFANLISLYDARISFGAFY